jgi:hypothetical protein
MVSHIIISETLNEAAIARIMLLFAFSRVHDAIIGIYSSGKTGSPGCVMSNASGSSSYDTSYQIY